MNLTAEKVHSTFMDCLFNDGENTEPHKIGIGVMMTVGFHPQRLQENESVIIEMLNDLPDTFKKEGGGGMSFLNMCQNKEDNQWADLHQTMDELVCLGNAIGKLSFLIPREVWHSLPGGVPYLVVS
jgi:hypothetical protein